MFTIARKTERSRALKGEVKGEYHEKESNGSSFGRDHGSRNAGRMRILRQFGRDAGSGGRHRRCGAGSRDF